MKKNTKIYYNRGIFFLNYFILNVGEINEKV